MNIFSQRHPVLLLSYFLFILASLLTMHPIMLGLALIGVSIYLWLLCGLHYVAKEIAYYVVVTLLIIIMFASFVHNGVTPLFFYNDHAVTKEALIKGGLLGIAVSSGALWCQALLLTMKTNHFLFLFTKIHPKLGLFCSMLFRFVPYYKETWQANKRGQQGVLYFKTASRFEAFGRYFILHFHTLTTVMEAVFWKPQVFYSKGYNRKRTQFELFTWNWRDSLLSMLLLGMVAYFTLELTIVRYNYFPMLAPISLPVPFLLSACLFYLLPAAIEGKELMRWHRLQSKI